MTSINRGLRRTVLTLLAVGGLALGAYAQQQQEHFLSEKVSEELKKLDEFQNKKQWDDAIRFVNTLIGTVKQGSYDEAMLSQILGKVYYMKNDFHGAIAPVARALELDAIGKFFKPEASQELRLLLIQAFFTDAQAKGGTLATQKEAYLSALKYMQEWEANNKKASPEVTTLHAYILFGLAQTNLGLPNKIDQTYIDKAQVVIERALTETAKPKEILYQLLIGCLQQRDNYARMAEVYELLVKLQPNNKQHWNTLFATYYQMSQDSNPETAFQYAIRSVVTMERAQALGHLNTPKDNFNRVAIFFNIQQHDYATKLLEDGLMKGTIEDTPKQWEILSYSYQQIAKDEDAIRVLREALRRYPDKGSFYMMIAQSYYNLDKARESYEACLDAIRVGNLEHPHTAHTFAANMAFQIRLFDEGLVQINKAIAFPESKKDTQLPKLKAALEEGIKEREINKRAIEAQHKNI